MKTENNILICYEKEMNYIAKQIKIIFCLAKVEVEHDIIGNYFLMVFKGHPLFNIASQRITHFELATKSYKQIIHEISKYLIVKMDI